ncbi:MAG: FAD-binding protein, partial [Flavobacterium sp.]
MPREFQFQVTPEVAANETLLNQYVAKLFNVSPKEIQKTVVVKRSIDARQKAIKVNIKANVFLVGEEFVESKIELPNYPNVANEKEVIVVGAGPAGLFAALQLIELGLKPIVLERGKDVRGRRRDLKAINVDHVVNEDSNYCFGEGGAGTYSDGKLYTRSKKRGDVDRILELLV